MIKQIYQRFQGYFALFVIAGTFGWSIMTVLQSQTKQPSDDTIVLRIAHWQLEAGVRDGLNEMAKEYQKLHPDKKIQIVQDAIPEGTYGQWLTTQLMGGNGPDLVELGHGCLPQAIWVAYYNRYFLPLGPYVSRPNPYNKGTDLEGVPLRLTVLDGMQTCYQPEVRDYMGISFSMFGTRIFYNKDLLKKLTGLETCPTNYRDFLTVCEKIKSQKDPTGKPYTPIAGSKYHLPMWETYLCDVVTYPLLKRLDFNHDNAISMDEMFLALKTGYVDANNPGFKARFQMIRQITDQFQSGWMGLGRDEAVFLFAQQKAVFLSTGTWDAMSLREQAEGRFEIRVMDFPLPTRDDPEFGSNVAGPIYEKPTVGFQFGVTRTCKNQDVAIDFLFFLASRKYNEQLNKIIGWIPETKGCKLDPLLSAFQPHLDGITPPFNAASFNIGGETWIKWLQCYSLFQVKKTDYEGMMKEFLEFYVKNGLQDYQEQVRNARRGFQKNEQMTAGVRDLAMNETADQATTEWIRYVNMKVTSQLLPDLSYNYQAYILRQKKPVLPPYGPYEYSPEVLAKVRRHVQQSMQTSSK